MPTRRYSREPGYSFIELLMVIVVLAIMLAVAFISIAPGLQRAKVNNAANVVAGDLQYAQVLAVRHRRPIAVIINSALQQYVIRERDVATNVYRTRVLGSESDFSLDEFTATPTTVELFPSGVARETMTVTVGLSGYQRQVRLTRAGQIRVLR